MCITFVLTGAVCITFRFIHLVNTFIQSNLEMRNNVHALMQQETLVLG